MNKKSMNSQMDPAYAGSSEEESAAKDHVVETNIRQANEVDTDQNSDEEMAMFASVWVKVEVNEPEEGSSESIKMSFKSKTKPKKKLRIHTKMLEYDRCKNSTEYSNSVRKHKKKKHQTTINASDSMPEFKCSQCDYVTLSKTTLKIHKRKHLLKQFECGDCPYKTAFKHNLDKHQRTHNVDTVYKCDKCPFVTKFEGHITRHLAKIHQEITDNASKCSYCDFSTTIKWRLNVHTQRSKQSEVLKCKHCDFETIYMCESKKHKKTHFNEIYTKKKTDTDYSDTTNNECSIYTADWSEINVIKTNDKDQPFRCEQCVYTSRFKASVQRHFQRHHTGNEDRPYKCLNCDFSTKTQGQISLHNKRSKSDPVLCCSVCGFQTNFKCQLAYHQKSHYENKCTLCDYSSKSKYDLQRHYSGGVHIGTRLKCQYCEYTASRKGSLLCHETIHTGKKPYSCDLCSFSSVRKCLLLCHMKKYHCEETSNVTVVSKNKIQSLKLPVQSITEQLETGNLDVCS